MHMPGGVNKATIYLLTSKGCECGSEDQENYNWAKHAAKKAIFNAKNSILQKFYEELEGRTENGKCLGLQSS